MKEIWKPIQNYKGLYEISNFGYVKSLIKSWICGKGTLYKKGVTILKYGIDGHGYRMVSLHKNKKKKTYMISHLVWDHFGDKPRNGRKLQVDHIKEKWNDRIDNLQLLNQRENISKGFVQNGKKSSKYSGICWNKASKKWSSQIQINHKSKHLGFFYNEKEASSEYQRALKEFIETGKIIINTPMMKRKTSKYKYVCWCKDRNKWCSRIYINKKQKFLGYFGDEYKAHLKCKRTLGDIKNV